MWRVPTKGRAGLHDELEGREENQRHGFISTINSGFCTDRWVGMENEAAAGCIFNYCKFPSSLEITLGT